MDRDIDLVQTLIETADMLSGKTTEFTEKFNPVTAAKFTALDIGMDLHSNKDRLRYLSKSYKARRYLRRAGNSLAFNLTFQAPMFAMIPAQIGLGKLNSKLMELEQQQADGERLSLDYVCKDVDDVIKNLKKEIWKNIKIEENTSLPKRTRNKAHEQLKILKIAYKKCLKTKQKLIKRRAIEKKRQAKAEAKRAKRGGDNA